MAHEALHPRTQAMVAREHTPPLSAGGGVGEGGSSRSPQRCSGPQESKAGRRPPPSQGVRSHKTQQAGPSDHTGHFSGP